MPSDIDAALKALPELPRALADEGYVPPDYRECYTAAASARFPATRIRGRWYVHPRDYPAIAAALSLRPKAERSALPQRSRGTSEPAPRVVAGRHAPALPAAAA